MSKTKSRNKLQVTILTILTVFVMCSATWAATYYASPTGGGDGSSPTSSFQISDFWSVASRGDTLYLLNGTYTGADSMIDPPDGKSGTDGKPIKIKALNEGDVLIDGQSTNTPVVLNSNKWFVLEGFNMTNPGNNWDGNVMIIRNNSENIIIRRVIGWDASATLNCNIFFVYNSSNVSFEDCAGWGKARKTFSSYYADEVTFRRCFARWTYRNTLTSNFGIGMSLTYNSTNQTIENCISTWDAYPDLTQEGMVLGGVYADDENLIGTSYKFFGNIAYILSSQNANYQKPRVVAKFSDAAFKNTNIQIKNFLSYTDVSFGLTNFAIKNQTFTAEYVTLVGGGNGIENDANYIDNVGSSLMKYIIQTDSISSHNGVNDGTTFDYIMFYNNAGDDYGGSAPSHYTTGTNPDLVGKCGNILQYGLSEENRPKVSGQSVGAKIQYRYVDGVLTNETLWPWPMNDRIKAAMVESGYDTKGGLDGKGGTDLTKTIFELGGGTLPSDFGGSEPNTHNDATTVAEDSGTTNINVTVNDDFGGDELAADDITITTGPSNGIAAVNNGGTPNDPTNDSIDYTPSTNFNGTDTVTYEICDSDGDRDTAILTITVTITDDPPPTITVCQTGGCNYTTIQQAINAAVPGDIIEVHSGTYNEAVNINKSGNANNWITLRAKANEAVWIDGIGLANVSNIDLNNNSYWQIIGLKLRYAGNRSSSPCTYTHVDGITVGIGGHHILIQNVEIKEPSGDGIDLEGGNHNIQILDSEIYDMRKDYPCWEGDGHGIHVLQEDIPEKTSIASYNILVKNNFVHDAHGKSGLATADWSDLNDSTPTNIIFENNKVQDCTNGIKVNTDSIFRYNLVIDTGKYTVSPDKPDNGFQAFTHDYNNNVRQAQIYNNTVVGFNNSYSFMVSGAATNQIVTVFKNNIAYKPKAYYVRSSQTEFTTKGNNLYFGRTNTAFDNYTHASSSLFADPLFTNPSSWDFTLTQNSPAIDEGEIIYPTQTYNGNGPDIGAFEYGVTPTDDAPNAPQNFIVVR